MKKTMMKNILLAFSGILALTVLPASAQEASFDRRTPLSDSVNTRDDESAAILSADAKKMYFVRSFHAGNIGGATGNQDIWVSERKSKNAWSAARNLGSPVNDQFHNAACGVSKDGNKLYLNAIKIRADKTVPGISVSENKDGKWSVPKAVSNYNFPEKGFFQVFVSYDESVAIVSFEGPETLGMEDLYLMKKDSNGLFANPVNLGNVLNTSGFETSPVLSPDGKTLYFSSNGRGGSGDGDIFRSRRLDDSWMNWSQPVNLGNKINTSGFDGSFSMDADSIGFFVSGEGNSGTGDLYTISMSPPPPPPPPPPVVKEKPARVDTFSLAMFESNSFEIRKSSRGDLNKVVKVLKDNTLFWIMVECHTDSVGSEAYNLKLSEKRAESVKQYLEEKGGIPASSIKTQGFGETYPVADNGTEEGRAKNRRVELKYFIRQN
jgi:outer membrane protein OmpA-like peptidoglycan-associated protein